MSGPAPDPVSQSVFSQDDIEVIHVHIKIWEALLSLLSYTHCIHSVMAVNIVPWKHQRRTSKLEWWVQEGLPSRAEMESQSQRLWGWKEPGAFKELRTNSPTRLKYSWVGGRLRQEANGAILAVMPGHLDFDLRSMRRVASGPLIQQCAGTLALWKGPWLVVYAHFYGVRSPHRAELRLPTV